MKVLGAIVLALAISLNGHSQQSNAQKVEQLVEAYHSLRGFNGSVLVAQNGNILLEKGYGIRTGDKSSANTPRTIFQLASITKQFTAALVLKMVELKKLQLNDKLSKFYPGFPNGDTITIEHLLSHTSGLHSYTDDDTTFMLANEKIMVSYIKRSNPDFKPGTSWHYSNSAYSILGYIIQKVSGMTYEKAMRKYIFDPLMMNSSGFDFINLKSENKAAGFDFIGDSSRLTPRLVDSSVSYGAGAIYSTVQDLYKWHEALQRYRVVNKELMDKAYTPILNHYGYGWQIDSMQGNRILSHSGSINGFGTNFARVTKDDVCIAVLSNRSGATFEAITITNKILAILYNQPYSVPINRVPIDLNEEKLKKFVGTYEIAEPPLVIELTLENGQLLAQPYRGPRGTMIPFGELDFYLKEDPDLELKFELNAEGKIEKMIVLQPGRTRDAKKVK